MKKKLIVLSSLLLTTLLLFLPILFQSDLLLNRSNDLQEFFWPIYLFTKNQIIKNHTLPLWNNLILSGTPLLPDPQAPLFYLPNLIFLFLPIGTAFILSSFFHVFLGGVGSFLVARKGLKLDFFPSLLAGILYILVPRTAGYLEAGHFGLIAASAWLPFVLLAAIKLAKEPKSSWSIFLGLALANLFFTHTVTFVTASLFSAFLCLLTSFLSNPKKLWLKSLKYLVLGAVFTFGLIAISFLPQIQWAGRTSRVTLVNDRQVYPIWQSRKEFLSAILIPWLKGQEGIWQLDTEKWLVLGIPFLVLAFLGFLQTKTWIKISLLLLDGLVLVLSLNNLSPIYDWLLNQNWYIFGRVSTRSWYLIVFSVILLACFAYQKINQTKKGFNFVKLLVPLIILELLVVSWIKITKPVPKSRFTPPEVYQFLSADKDRFRVFCLNRCLSQRQAAEYGLELIEGYSTLHQMNYYKHSWQLTGAYWNFYTLAIPPMGFYELGLLKPDFVSLGEYNLKYFVSPKEWTDSNLVLEKKIGDFFIYSNKAFQPRANVPIEVYQPNYIRLDTKDFSGKQIKLAEVYNPDWQAYLNGKEKVEILETPSSLRAINLKSETEFVDLRYQPPSFKYGQIITFTTLVIFSVWAIKQLTG